jgi:primosomal protein N' (replication factor Y)
MKIVAVIPLEKGPLRENLTYFTTKKIENGDIVSIPVRNKKILGLVVSSEDIKDVKSDIRNMSFNLKKILDVKTHSIFLREFWESILSASEFFAFKKNALASSLIPSILRQKYDKIAEFKNKTKEIRNTPSNLRSEKLLFQVPFDDRISFYKTFIRGLFAEKKSVFITLPTEIDIKIFYEHLSKGIENFTFAVHGGLSTKKQLEKIEEILISPHPILVLGTVPFLSIPRKDYGAIITEHESSVAYKTVGNQHLDLRIFAEIFASKINAKFVLGDSLLRFETIARKEMDNFSEVHPLSFKVNFSGNIEILGKEPTSGNKFKVLSDNSIEEIQTTLKKKENVFIFSLRKGLATMTMCQNCGEIINCEKCLSPLVLYHSHDNKKRIFVCNRCGIEKSSEILCSVCRSWNLVPLGIGTDTVLNEVKKKFSDVKIFKLDKGSIKTAKEAEKVIKEFEKSAGSILIGTEMALFYLKGKVALSVLASFDSLWSIPNFKTNEKIVQLILSLSHKTKNKIIIQTKNENDPVLTSIISESLSSFIREELEERKKMGYPPYKRFIKISYLGNKEEIINAKNQLIEVFKEYDPEIFGGFIAKQKNNCVVNALLRINRERWSLPELSARTSIDKNLLEKLLSLPRNFSINIDPENLL